MLKQALSDDELDLVAGGIQISRSSENNGMVYFNGQSYPFSDYQALLAVAQNCVASGHYTDDDLFAAFRAAGII